MPRENAAPGCVSGRPQKKFTEPVALSSAEPVGFPLPRTAPRLGFDLLALRARCKGEASRCRAACKIVQEEKHAICANFTKAGVTSIFSTTLQGRTGIRRAGGAFVHRADGLSASAYDLSAQFVYSRSVLGAARIYFAAPPALQACRRHEKARSLHGRSRRGGDGAKRPLVAVLRFASRLDITPLIVRTGQSAGKRPRAAKHRDEERL